MSLLSAPRDPYRDESGLRVIGYGHVLNDYETFSHFTREVAETLLTVDLLQCQRELKRSLRVTLNQAQYDALVSLAFSCGAASPALNIVLTHLNHQRFAEALNAWGNIRSGREQRREECARFKACTD
ncbi:glycoside hydrolase family protein [Klebsiella grimontii]|uniref:glycoside hydrolase family protein n=1 Tax=Klebsiella grimontii TaxID=2058152 RepID=UPI003101A41F